MSTRPGVKRSAHRLQWKRTCWISASTCARILACPARSRSPMILTVCWCQLRSGRPRETGTLFQALELRLNDFDAAAQPGLKILDDLRRERRGLACRLVDQNSHGLRRGDACVFRKYHLVEGHRGPAELDEPETHFDFARPAQFSAEMDIQPHHDPSKARRHQPIT